MDDLKSALTSSVSALRAQSVRLRVAAENLANANVTGREAGADPYRRKAVSFGETIDRMTGARTVEVRRIEQDQSAFQIVHDPGHPAADARGDVKLPNVNPLIEIADLREANRSYDANLQVVRQVREMNSDMIDLLKVR